jgi:hypothetical protein
MPKHANSRDFSSCFLRARRERPSRRRAAEKRDELAPLHVPPENQAFPKCQKPSTLRPGRVRRIGAQPNVYFSGGLMSALGH